MTLLTFCFYNVIPSVLKFCHVQMENEIAHFKEFYKRNLGVGRDLSNEKSQPGHYRAHTRLAHF